MRSTRFPLMLAAGLCIGLPACGFAATATYVGEWHNDFFNSSGPASFEITILGNMFNITMDLDGDVFGQGNPDPVTVSGPFDPLTGNGSFDLNDDPWFGDVSGSVAGASTIIANAINVPGPIASASLNGSISEAEISLTYTVVFEPVPPGSPVNGTITALRVVPVPAALPLFLSGLALVALTRRKRAAR